MATITFTHNAIDKHRSLADAIKENLQVEDTTITERESHSAYNANLPEGITPETVKELSKYNTSFHAAAFVAVGETAAEIFAANEAATRVNATLGYNAKGDTLTMTADRSASYPNPQHKDNPSLPEKITKQLVVTSTVTLRGTSTKSVRSALSEAFENHFAK